MIQKKKLKALLFDLDGTLLHTAKDITNALNVALLAAQGEVLSVEQCMTHVGRGLRNALTGALHAQDIYPTPDQLNTLIETMMEAYRSQPVDFSFIYPGMSDLLDRAVKHNMVLGVLSNKADELVKVIVKHFFSDYPFVFVEGASSRYPLKPDPSSLLSFKKSVGCEADELMLIGDSEVDYVTAQNGGCDVAIVTWGFREKKELIAAGCSPLCDTIEDLNVEVFDGRH
ncbi:MAG: HAD family hydrolase [Sphaerochaetaceae bacterium]|jgi:phosphoglycolate phosphatase